MDHINGTASCDYTHGAKEDAELIARLLNWYYDNPDAAETQLEDDQLRYTTCSVCGKLFTADEWEERHEDDDGEDCHEQCCPGCNHD
jgi:hypothetical protein